MKARRALLLLAPLALAIALPTVAAEHEFSHRVEIFGRVVDAENRPVPGVTLQLSFEGMEANSQCLDTRSDKTNETGDFHLCRHKHDVPRGVRAIINVANATARVPLDPLLRRAYVLIELDEEWPVRSIQGERAFFRNFTVTGRIVDERAQPVNMEGVNVNATPLAGRDVNVSLLAGDGRLVANATARTGLYGDFRADLFLEELPEGLVAHVEYGSGVKRVDATEARRVDVVVVHRVDPTTRITPPGAESGQIPLGGGALALVAVAAASGLLGRRRRLS